MRYKKITRLGLSINTYLLIDSATNQAAVIDPVRDINPLLEVIATEKCDLRYIFETHVHADFVSGAKELKNHFGNAPLIICSGEGGKEWSPVYADRLVKDQDMIQLGALQLQAWHVPGHTPEHMMWIVIKEGNPVLAFTGDFLLIGSVGRPDLLGGEKGVELAKNLYESVFEKLARLPDSLIILPAHGAGSLCGKGISDKPSSTLGEERRSNPYLAKVEKRDWRAKLFHKMPKAPSYFTHLKQVNVKGAPLVSTLLEPKLSSMPQEYIVDLRHQEEFASKHMLNAINIPYSPLFSKWAGEIIPHNQSVTLAANDLETIERAIAALRIVGIDKITGYVLLSDVEAKEAFDLLKPETVYEEELIVVDVRTDEEWTQGHIRDALHIPLQELNRRMTEIPKDKKIVVTCGSGYRSSIGVSLLRRAGFPEITALKGGMEGWKNAKLPLSEG